MAQDWFAANAPTMDAGPIIIRPREQVMQQIANIKAPAPAAQPKASSGDWFADNTPQAPKATDAERRDVLGFLGNVASSTGRLVEGAIDIPQQVRGITGLFAGMAEKSGFKPLPGSTETDAIDAQLPYGTHTNAVDALVAHYKDRYGSWDGFKKAMYEDPAGVAFDASMILEPAAAGLKGIALARAGELGSVGLAREAALQSSRLGRAGVLTAQAAHVVNPLTLAGKAIGAVRYAEPALQTTEDVMRAAAKAGGRDVALGAGTMGAGALAAKYGLFGDIANAVAGVSIGQKGLRQLAKGIRAGYEAGKEVLSPAELVRAESPPGFGVAAGSTAEPIPASVAPAGPVYQPPASGALPGTVAAPTVTVEDALRRQGYGIAGASTAEPIPAAAPPAGPVYQPPVSGALPGTAPPATPPAPATTPALALRQALEDLQQRRAEAAAGPMTQAKADALFEAEQAVSKLEPDTGESVFQEQKSRIAEGMTPPETPPPAPAPAPAPAPTPAPAGEVLPEGHVAVPEGSVVVPDEEVVRGRMPEGLPEHYREHFAREGGTNAERDFRKDVRVGTYVLSKGIGPDEFAALPLEEQNKLILEAPTKSGKRKHKPYIQPAPGQARTMGRWADEGISHITDTMRWLQKQGGAESPAVMQTIFEQEKAAQAPAAMEQEIRRHRGR